MSNKQEINVEAWCQAIQKLINDTPLTAAYRNGLLDGLQTVYDKCVPPVEVKEEQPKEDQQPKEGE